MSKLDFELKNNLNEVLTAAEKQIANGLWAVGATAEGYAKDQLYEGHGVDTGRLRNSITHATKDKHNSGSSPAKAEDYATLATPEEHTVYIGTNVEYAPYIENGSSKRVGYHFLRNAMANNVDEYKKILEAALKS